MKPLTKARKALEKAGYTLKRRSGHDIYYHPELKKIIPLKRHDFDENDLRYILDEIEKNNR